ncbi:MAG TPA: glycosyltransferase [Candidatus Limnocylindrales bacterium]|nr:glycosyltransferase [Candidatus Limnocylindrales bacterium]
MPGRPITLLVVAGWYPSVLDQVAGRFVADQVEALAATGIVRPSVASFDPADLVGSGRLRADTAAAIRRLAGDSIRGAEEVFAAGSGIPVARLPIAGGRDPSAGPAHAAAARRAALEALADRWLSGREAVVPRPDIVHAHTVYPDGVAAAALARRLGCPLVLTEHASFVGRLIAEPAVRAAYVETVRAAGRLLAVSRTLAAELVAALPEVEPRLEVLPNAVPLDAFRAAPRAERRAGELVFVGYRKPSKGIDSLLEAVARARRDRPAVTLRMIGSSPTEAIEAGWRRRIAELDLADAVTLEPAADRAGVAAALARAALFVHPSPRETFGVVAAEALAAGLPVVAADSGGVTEILGPEPDRVGAVVPPDDPEALAAAIVRTLDRIESFDPDVLRASIANRMSDTVVADRLAGLYASLLPAPESPGGAADEPPDTPLDGIPDGRPAVPDRPRPRPVRVAVALDRGRASLLGALPAEARAAVVLATSGGRDALPGGLAGVVEAPLGDRIRSVADRAAIGSPRGWRRVARALRHPLAVARRRGWLPGLRRALATDGVATVRAALVTARGLAGPDGEVELVCIDGVDYLAAEPLVASGEATLVPGGLRRLGDQPG